MADLDFPWHRLALITSLAQKAPGIGRTAIMKCAYLLQTVRGVPLGYHFTLYSYGPYDTDVLYDLSYAQTLKAVAVQTVYFAHGYGYDVRPGEAADRVKARAAPFLATHQKDIDWVVEEFACRPAGDLELISTLIYADRALAGKLKVTLAELARRVQAVKPHFTTEQVVQMAEALRKKGLLEGVK